eukprot:scaffold11962_cov52-Phaeocystis_antarctica.AAC.3
MAARIFWSSACFCSSIDSRASSSCGCCGACEPHGRVSPGKSSGCAAASRRRCSDARGRAVRGKRTVFASWRWRCSP